MHLTNIKAYYFDHMLYCCSRAVRDILNKNPYKIYILQDSITKATAAAKLFHKQNQQRESNFQLK